jgi:hypothetical protein
LLSLRLFFSRSSHRKYTGAASIQVVAFLIVSAFRHSGFPVFPALQSFRICYRSGLPFALAILRSFQSLQTKDIEKVDS